MDKEVTNVSIPTSLIKKIEEEIKGSEKKSVEEFIVNMLKEKFPEDKGDAFSEEDEKKVKERLKALGYID